MARGKLALTEATHKEIVTYVTAGAPLPLAADAAGLSWDTVKEWLKPEKAKREPYKSFVEAVNRAKAVWACAAVMRITKAGKRGNWAADLAMLERREPEHFRPAPQQLEHSGKKGGAPIPVELSSKESLAQKLERLSKKRPAT